MFWKKKKLTAIEARIASQLAIVERRAKDEAFILNDILSVAKCGRFHLTISMTYFPLQSFLEGLGYKVTTESVLDYESDYYGRPLGMKQKDVLKISWEMEKQ